MRAGEGGAGGRRSVARAGGRRKDLLGLGGVGEVSEGARTTNFLH